MRKVRKYLYKSLLKINEEVLDNVIEKIGKSATNNYRSVVEKEDYEILSKTLTKDDLDDIKVINEEMLKKIEKLIFEKFDKKGAFYKESKLKLAELILLRDRIIGNRDLKLSGNISDEFENIVKINIEVIR